MQVAIAFPVYCWKMLLAFRRRKDTQSDQVHAKAQSVQHIAHLFCCCLLTEFRKKCVAHSGLPLLLLSARYLLCIAVHLFDMLRYIFSSQDLFIYIGVCLIDVASFALFLVVGLVGLYQLILYKMQAAVFFMVPRDEDLVNFR